MLITYLRSSSFNTYSDCQHKYFLQYVLGVEHKVKKNTVQGTMIHKALELLASKKMAMQLGKESFFDDSLNREVQVSEVDYDFCVEQAFKLYSINDELQDWCCDDINFVRKSFLKALKDEGGKFNPENREIFAVEKFFDIAFDEDWAYYEYEVQGQKLVGQLSIRGTCDLLLHNLDNPDTIEYLDWKSGAYRTDWSTGELKTDASVRKDPQLMIYNYALRQLYPEFDDMVFTVHYINAGGPITDAFYKSDTERCKQAIKKRFLEIKENVEPTWLWGEKPDERWKCNHVCYFGKKILPNGRTVCQHTKNLCEKKGIHAVTEKHAKLDKLTIYEGGGAAVQL